MQFGIKLANCERLPLADGVGRMAVAAEKFGYDSVWVADHVVIPTDLTIDEAHAANNEFMHKQNGDALMSLAFAAGMTKKVKLGTSIMVLPLRNPLLAAKMLATLDDLSGGRAILGTGIGWLAEEFERLEAPDFKKRGKVTDEWIKIMRACWTEKSPSYKGEHYSFSPIHFSPQPKKPIPIWIGGNSDAALARVGRLGDGWLGTRQSPDDLRAAVPKAKQAAEAAGRDPGKLVFAVGVECDILAPGAAKPTTGLFAGAEKGLIGTVNEIIDRIGAYQKAGADCIELRIRTARDENIKTIEPTIEMMERFSKEVMGKFRGK